MIHLRQIVLDSRSLRRGFMGACHKAGCALNPTAPWLDVSDAEYERLKAEHAPGFRLGDAVAFIAQPIAGLIDRVFGTSLKNCGGCKGRRARLNRISLRRLLD